MNKSLQAASTTSGISRRVLVKGAAWSVPVIAAAVATPLAAASVIVNDATFWGTFTSASVVSGNVLTYRLEGQDSEGNDALLPVGSTVIFTVDPGVTLELVSMEGIVATAHADGTITAIIASDSVTVGRIRFRAHGPSGAGFTIKTNVNIAPFEEVVPVVIQ